MGFFIFDFLKVVMLAIAQLLGFGRLKHTDGSGLQIFVKFVNQRAGSSNVPTSLPIDVQPDWSIRQVKDAIAKKLNLEVGDLKIIFAGHELRNDIKVKECDLGQQSVLHAVQLVHHRVKDHTSSESEPLNKTINKILDEQDMEPETAGDGAGPAAAAPPGDVASHSSFHVYCSGPCGGLRRGKLRVRCASCRQGAFTVHRDPCCWDDVLAPRRVQGTCDSSDCDGDFAEFFFKCGEHTSLGEDDEAVPLDLVRNNLRQIPCLACADVSDLVVMYPCAAGHVTCLECFVTFCRSRLDERRFVQDPALGYTLGCPAGCAQSLITEAHHFRLMGDEQYERYQRFAAEECVLQAGGVLCPRPGCGMGLMPDELCRRIQCQQGCGFVFCRDCLQGYHLGACDRDAAAGGGTIGGMQAFGVDEAAQARWEEATRTTIQVITKPCPKCRTPTERDGGCMHMICPRSQCGFHWCWVCQAEWTRECMGNHWFG